MKSISIFFLLGLSCLHISAQKHKVLFLGNSYTAVNNLPSLFTALALSGGDTVITDANTPGGYTFQGHSTNLTSLSKIQADAWDYVILQEQSQLPSFPPSQVATDCFPYAKILDSLIHINDACTKTVFYMTWGRKYGDASNCASYPPVCTFDGMQTRLRDSYVQMGDDNQAYVAPVGMAWKAARLADSTINLWSADNSHPSMAGSYLAACVFYATLFEKTPVGLTYTSGLPTNTVNFLQNIAHHTVFDSLSTWNIGEFDPVSAFSYTQNGYGISLQENSDFATSFHWELGNGDTLNGENVSYTYPYPGSYLLKLIAYNDCGKSDTSTQEITVSPPIWAYQQAQSLEKGINLSYLENYWAGNPNIHYSDYLHSLPNVSTYKNDIALMAEMASKRFVFLFASMYGKTISPLIR